MANQSDTRTRNQKSKQDSMAMAVYAGIMLGVLRPQALADDN